MWLYSVEMKNPFAQLHTDLQNVSLIKWDLNTGLYDHVAYFSYPSKHVIQKHIHHLIYCAAFAM